MHREVLVQFDDGSSEHSFKRGVIPAFYPMKSEAFLSTERLALSRMGATEKHPKPNARVPAYERRKRCCRDVSRGPLVFAGHAVSYRDASATRQWYGCVRIERREHQALRRFFLARAIWHRPDKLAELFNALPYDR